MTNQHFVAIGLREGGAVLSKSVRIGLIVAVFGLAGPPLGGLVAWAMMGARTMRSPLPFVTGAYGEAYVLALGTGFLVAIAGVLFGKTSWLVPALATLLVNAAFMVLTVVPQPSDPDLFAPLARVAHVFLPTSLAASLACWLMVQRLLKSP